MTLENAYSYFENLSLEATRKSEIKVYAQFLHILSKLKDRSFSTEDLKSIETELDRLNLESNPQNKKKYFKKALNSFEKYLKTKFSLTTKGHYTNLGMGLGLSFGLMFGVAILSNLERSLGISIGLLGGMLVGSVWGRQKDAEAKATGNML